MQEHRISTNNSSYELQGNRRKLRKQRDGLRHFLKNKRGYSTEGSTLLPSVLRPRLFSAVSIITGACIVSGVVCSASNTFATVQATLTIPDSISVNVNPNENNGFAEGAIGQVEVSTNNQAGYTLSIKSKDGTELRNGDNILNSIPTNLTADQYQNGEYYNTWGFKPDVVNSVANTSFIPAPSANGILLAETNVSSAVPDTFNLAIATKVNQNAVAGNYTNSFVLTSTGKEASYNITFNVGDGSGGPEKPKTGYIGDDLEVQIPTATPSMEGKDFLGWCTKTPKEDGTCTGVVVQPGGCFPLCKCDLNLTLYAMYGTKSTGGGGAGSGAPSGTFSGMSNSTPCESGGYQGTVYAGLCWMDSDLFTNNRNFYQAVAECAVVGWRLPSETDFKALIGSNGAGSGAELYDAGWNGNYWSSTPYSNNSSVAYYINVTSSSAKFVEDITRLMPNLYSVRCVAG